MIRYVALGLAAAGVLAFAVAIALKPTRGAERPAWRIEICEPAKPCALFGPRLPGPTACNIVLADLVKELPSATRIACVRGDRSNAR